jgi:cell division septation protein DedD
MVVCAVIGFYIGRNVLGARYLKLAATRVETRPLVPMAPRAPIEPPLVEEPQSAIEPAQPTPEPELPPDRSSRRAARRPAAAPAPAKTVTLQLGSYLKPENAKAMVQDLRNRGYSPSVVVEKQGPSTVHKVQMRQLSPEGARALASELKREGYQVGVLEGK